jgi:multidrug efflux system outer membrane protein
MYSKRGSGLLLILVFFSFALEAEEGRNELLTLETAVERAIIQSFDLQKGEIDLNTARVADKNIWAELFPSISAGASVRYSTSLSRPPSPAPEPGFGISASLSLQLNAGLPAAMRLIRLAYNASLLSYENGKRQLALAVTKQFYKLLTDKDSLAILEEKLSQAQRHLENDKVRFQNGMLSELNYERSRLSVETAKFEFNRALSAFDEETGSFIVSLGFSEDDTVDFQGELTVEKLDFDPGTLLALYLPRRPDIVSQEQTIERLKLTYTQRSLVARAPSLSLSAGWSGSMDAEFSDSVTGNVSVSIPVESWIPGTKSNQGINAALSDVDKAELDLANLRINAESNIRSLVTSLRNTWNSIEISRLRVELAERTYQMSERAFSQGTIEFLALETARNDLSEARQQLLSEELSYKAAGLDLAGALNIDLEELISRKKQ